MSWFLFLVLPVVLFGSVITGVTLWWHRTRTGASGSEDFMLDRPAQFFGTIGLCFAIFAVSLTFGINQAGRALTVESCRNWGINNNRPTKFISNTWWSYDCATPDGHGHWIPIGQVIVNTPNNGG